MYQQITLGTQFNCFTTIDEVKPRKSHNGKKLRTRYFVKCRCVCNTEKEIEVSNLKSGHVKSCGCVKWEPTNKTHGRKPRGRDAAGFSVAPILNNKMQKPKDLDEVAAKFWARHHKRLTDNGLLNEATYDSFVLLCRVHSLLSRLSPDEDPKTGIIKFVALSKQYQQLARGFGMNTDKPRQPEAQEAKDEFGL